MSKDDWETSKTLLNPYIEIGKSQRGFESNPIEHAAVNVSTFADCLGRLIRPFNDNGPILIRNPEKIYCVYAVVGRSVPGGGDVYAYLNIDEPPISRTLIGYIEEKFLKEKLPKTLESLLR